MQALKTRALIALGINAVACSGPVSTDIAHMGWRGLLAMSLQKKSRLLEKIDRVPPVVCRLLARKCNGRKGMTITDIASASGLPRSTVFSISERTTWKGISPEVADAFAGACGIDLMAPYYDIYEFRRRVRSYLYRGHWKQVQGYQRILQARRQMAA